MMDFMLVINLLEPVSKSSERSRDKAKMDEEADARAGVHAVCRCAAPHPEYFLTPYR
jgi:hypothetical protein